MQNPKFQTQALVGTTLLVLALLTGRATADAYYAEVQVEGWTFAPILQNQKVSSLFAWVDDSLAKGDNIRAMYFTRDSNGEWEARAWEDATIEEAATYVYLTIDDSAQFYVSEISEEPCLIVEPVVLLNGLFPDDPFQPVIQSSEEQEALIRKLVLYGYPVAPSISELMVADPVGSIEMLTAFLDEIAAKIELAVFGQTNLQQMGLWPCSCTTTYGVPTCGPWVYLYSCAGTGGLIICHYERSCTRPWTLTGKHWYCTSCAATGTENYTETGRTNALPGDPCVAPPP